MGNDPAQVDLAAALGRAVAGRGLRLVFGGGRVGLMGVVADNALAAGGEVVGVMPHALVDREIAHTGLTELHITGSMHERKAMMEQLSDGFIALPGGFGTLDEFAEMVTWGLLGYHHKPIGMLDVNGYYDSMRAFFDHAVEAGFVRADQRQIILEAASPDALLDEMAAWHSTLRAKWSEPSDLTGNS
jgi:uncharacterized protein (TIGR00730 family)